MDNSGSRTNKIIPVVIDADAFITAAQFNSFFERFTTFKSENCSKWNIGNKNRWIFSIRKIHVSDEFDIAYGRFYPFLKVFANGALYLFRNVFCFCDICKNFGINLLPFNPMWSDVPFELFPGN